MRIALVIFMAVIAAGVSYIAWTIYDDRATAQRIAAYQAREQRIEDNLKECNDERKSPAVRQMYCGFVQGDLDDKLDEMFGRPVGTARKEREARTAAEAAGAPAASNGQTTAPGRQTGQT